MERDVLYWRVNGEEGWRVEECDNRFEVYYHTNECMRLGADGSLSFGRPKGYWFDTKEWAELCAQRLNSLEDAFGRRTSGIAFTASCITATPQSFQYETSFRVQAKLLISIDQNGNVTTFDLPRMIGLWWRTTAAHRFLVHLWYGERRAYGA